MNEIKMTKIGTLNLYGSRYAVLDKDQKESFPVPLHWQASILKVEHKVPYLLVAKEFIIERNYEGITMADRVFIAPHYISVSGDFAIEWLPLPEPITILMPIEGEVIE